MTIERHITNVVEHGSDFRTEQLSIHVDVLSALLQNKPYSFSAQSVNFYGVLAGKVHIVSEKMGKIEFFKNIFDFLNFLKFFSQTSKKLLLPTRDFGGRRQITSYATEKYF
jgi:hypothetical protein